MQRPLPPLHYSKLAVILHWILAFSLAFQMGLGWQMSELIDASDSMQGLFTVTQLHKSIGILILLASIARLILRYYKKPPLALGDDAWAHKLSKYTHAALYIFMIGAPLSGWLLVSSSDLKIDTYIFGAIYWPHIPGIANLSEASRSILYIISSNAHEILSWAGIALFFLHVAGALRHQFFKGEPILWRILPIIKPLDRNQATLAMTLIVTALIGLFAFAQFNILGAVKPISTDAKPPLAAEPPSPLSEALSSDELEAKPQETEDIDAADALVEPIEKDNETAAPVIKEGISKEAIKPSDWTIIGAQSLEFSVKWNDEIVRGSFSDWSGDIRFASEALEQSSIKILINLTSVTTSDASVNSAIGSVDFFNSSATPEAQYISNSIKKIGDNRYQMDGNLRLKNINQPLRIIFTLDENGNNARAKGSANIDRLAYNIGVGQNEIANNVRLTFDFMAKK